MTVRFVAREGDGTIAGALARIGEPVRAVGEGRVFVERRRADRADRSVSPGDEIVVEPGSLRPSSITILGELGGLYAVLKPSGLSTEPDRRGSRSLVLALAEILGEAPSALHAATRLDAKVSGLVVVARGDEAARRVSALQRAGKLHRRYVALASGRVRPLRGSWDAPIGTGARGRPVAFGRDARPAVTHYRVVAESPAAAPSPLTVLLLEPETGRSHQLRVHAALAGAPLLGDGARGGPSRVVRADGSVLPVDRVALHAFAISIGEGSAVEWTVTAALPEELAAWFEAAGGDRSALDSVATAPLLYGMDPP